MGEPSNIKKLDGFTLIELMMIIVVVGVLATITGLFILPNWHERTYYSKAISEMNTLANGVSLYVAKYNDYPPDVTRSIPAVLNEFLQTNGQNGSWPAIGPWPGSVWDWDNWPPDSNGPLQTYQVSIRFCNAGDTNTCKKNFPKESWVNSNWDSYSAVYFCISGSCRAHQNFPLDHPGYCVNCGTSNQAFQGGS